MKMGNTLRKSTSRLQKIADGTDKQEPEPAIEEPTDNQHQVKKQRPEGEVMIGASFPRIVRRSISQLQADPRNDGKTLKDLLAEALDDLFAKYNVPQTARVDRKS
jgi:hypothetical protein